MTVRTLRPWAVPLPSRSFDGYCGMYFSPAPFQAWSFTGLTCRKDISVSTGKRLSLALAPLLKYLHALQRDGDARRRPGLNGYF
jgi:hypothetical protein